MIKRLRRLGIGVLLLGSLACNQFAFAQVAVGGVESDLAKRILNEGWDRSPKARADAQAWFDSAPAEIRSSKVVQWAYALNRLHHRKYRDAKPFVDELAQKDPFDWDVAYARIWLATFVKEFDHGLALMQQLKQNMAAAANLSAAQKTEIYFRLGRLVGYLQGPNGNRVNRQSLENMVASLLEGAGEEANQAFSQQRDAVLGEYQALMAEREDKQVKKMETLVRQQQVDIEQQTNLAEQMKTQSADARANRERVITEGQNAVDRSKAELDTASAEWNRQQSIISSARCDLDGLWISIAQIDDALLREKDPLIRQRLLADRNYFLFLVRDKEFYLSSLRADANATYSLLGSASVNFDQALANLRGRSNEIDRQIALSDASLSKANRRIRSLQAEPKVSNALVATIDSTAQALTNYDPFPTEVLKKRLLDALLDAGK